MNAKGKPIPMVATRRNLMPAARARTYLQRPELRTHPVSTLARRAYFETIRRLVPKRLARPHRSQLRWTNYRFEAPLTESIGRSLFLYGVYEPLATALFHAMLDDGNVAVDVGAHYGDFTLVAAATVGAEGRVLAFEPQEHVRRVLARNITLNGIDNVDVFSCALADHAGEARLYSTIDPAHTGGASLSMSPGGHSAEYTDVSLGRLDDIVDPQIVDQVRAVKIDVEGAEAAVLRGARAILDKASPGVLFEVNDLRSIDGYVDCDALVVLHTAGYSSYGVLPDPVRQFRLELLRTGEDPERFREPWLALNMVALVPGSPCYERLGSSGYLDPT